MKYRVRLGNGGLSVSLAEFRPGGGNCQRAVAGCRDRPGRHPVKRSLWRKALAAESCGDCRAMVEHIDIEWSFADRHRGGEQRLRGGLAGGDYGAELIRTMAVAP